MPSGAPYMAAPREQVLDLWAGPGDSLHSYIDTRMEKKRARSRRDALCPPIGALLRYRTRIVRVIAEARGQRGVGNAR